ncbi:MAG: FAD-dependent oxidoreductase [Candidatus Nealsonbacteria bacterium]|nr:MAG: FAD-dependent oxidoreductase [Candidatus Nealsonbacteria bacterium]
MEAEGRIIFSDNLNNKKEIFEPEKRVPVLMNVDVAIVGGGVAGIAAAIAAAREGAKTVLIERDGCLGGTATVGMMCVFQGADFSVVRGIFYELVERLKEQQGIVLGSNACHAPFDPEIFKFVSEQMVLESGSKILYHTYFSKVIVRDKVVEGIIVETEGRRCAILAKNTIDTSGNADVIASVNAPFEKNEYVQPVSLVFRMDHIDLMKLVEYIKTNPDQFYSAPGQRTWLIDQDPPFFTVGGFFGLIKYAKSKKELYLPHESIWLGVLPRKGELFINATRVVGVDGLNCIDLTKAIIDTRKQMWSVAKFLIRYVPGFKEAQIVDSGVRIGVRETRRAIGEYMLTKDDLLTGKRFSDAIANYNFPMDVHSPKGKEEGHGWTLVPTSYDIPFRSLIPKNYKRLLVGGRCISTDHEAHGSTRSMPCCMATGQAAGVAAAIAANKGIAIRDIDIRELRNALLKQNVLLKE